MPARAHFQKQKQRRHSILALLDVRAADLERPLSCCSTLHCCRSQAHLCKGPGYEDRCQLEDAVRRRNRLLCRDEGIQPPKAGNVPSPRVASKLRAAETVLCDTGPIYCQQEGADVATDGCICLDLLFREPVAQSLPSNLSGLLQRASICTGACLIATAQIRACRGGLRPPCNILFDAVTCSLLWLGAVDMRPHKDPLIGGARSLHLTTLMCPDSSSRRPGRSPTTKAREAVKTGKLQEAGLQALRYSHSLLKEKKCSCYMRNLASMFS